MPQLPYLKDKIPSKGFRGSRNLHTGFCYAASEAIYHLSEDPLEPWWLRYGPAKHQTHWFLKLVEDGTLIDVTASQYNDTMLYDLYGRARRRAFLTKHPSKRAQMILDRIHPGVYFPRAFHHDRAGLEEMTPDGHPWWVREIERKQRRARDSNPEAAE